MKIRVGILTAPHIDYERRENGTFLIKNVRIGIGFHWDRNEDQIFEGELEILHNADGTETAVNIIDLEDYLTSVISSEMSALSSPELLKAHTVISRSWVMRLIERERRIASAGTIRSKAFEDGGHVGFDVCADDHCQRYEGLLRRNEKAVEAVRATAHQVLTYDGEICDTRFSKCCGGHSEEFEYCWDDIHYPYLESVECPYCDTHDAKVLRTVLNNYDQETQDFHDWQVRYSAQELHDILLEKSGIDFGEIQEMIPLKRGKSGRIYLLKIVGSKHTEEIGKELKIRRWLSHKCLYSSWFDVSREGTDWVLTGHGWGHGVGLCQIGAAVMAEQGFTYEQILAHYFKGSVLQVREA